jgi:alkylation response protein AidB-like acyl-CoA dehydrogenase
VTLFLVDANSTGISLTPLQNIAGGALYEVNFADVVTPAETIVGARDDGWPPLSLSTTKAAVLQTATIVGAARSVLEMTNQYAKDRVQFEQPIGKYQAVQYMVSDILFDMHSVELLAKQAAYRIDVGKPFRREAAIAIAHGKRAAAHLHRQAHEVHAGVGFILDHDLTLFSRRSKFWENNLGDARFHQEQLAREMIVSSADHV